MSENIEIGTAVVKADDAQGAVITANSAVALSDAEFADRLEAVARDIDTFERTRRKMILRIAKLVSDAHDLFLYRRNEGGFTGWMKTRFDCSPSSAYRLLDVHKRFGNGESFPNWETLSDSALYLLAPPSVPQEALDEVTERIEAGEQPTCAMVTEVIAKAKDKTAESAGDAEIHDIDAVDEDPSIKQRRAEHAALFADHVWESAEAISVEAENTESDAEELFEFWTESTPQAQQFIRDLVLEEYFAQASGADIYARIPAARLDEVIPAFLDKLTVEGMRTRMSDPFGQEARRKLAAPGKAKKSAKKWKRSINHRPANHAHQRDHRSRH